MKYILEPLTSVANCNNDYMGAFINLMRYKGKSLDDIFVQLIYAGIKLKLTNDDDVRLVPNYVQGVQNFCAAKRIMFREMEIDPSDMKERLYDILNSDGACMAVLNSYDLHYYQAFVRDNVPRCILITGVEDEGLHVVDSVSAPTPGCTFQGFVPFSDIGEMQSGKKIKLFFVEGEPEFVVEQSMTRLREEQKKFMNENIYMEFGSRLKACADFCDYLWANPSIFQGYMLRKIANNILEDTHVPQLSMIMRMFCGEYYGRLNRLCKDWTTLAYRCIKDSLGMSAGEQEVLLDNYKALIDREREIYMSAANEKE